MEERVSALFVCFWVAKAEEIVWSSWINKLRASTHVLWKARESSLQGTDITEPPIKWYDNM